MDSTTTVISSRKGGWGLQDHTALQPTKPETTKDHPQTDPLRPHTGLEPGAMGGQGTGEGQEGGWEDPDLGQKSR